MFNLGAPEIMVILVVALIVLGPKRLPQAGRQVGRALAEFRRVTSDVKSDLQEALAVDDLRDAFGVADVRNELGLDSLRDSFDLRKGWTGPAKPVSPGGPRDLRSPYEQQPGGTYPDPSTISPPDGLLAEPSEHESTQQSTPQTPRSDVPAPPPTDRPDTLQGLYKTARVIDDPRVGP